MKKLYEYTIKEITDICGDEYLRSKDTNSGYEWRILTYKDIEASVTDYPVPKDYIQGCVLDFGIKVKNNLGEIATWTPEDIINKVNIINQGDLLRIEIKLHHSLHPEPVINRLTRIDY